MSSNLATPTSQKIKKYINIFYCKGGAGGGKRRPIIKSRYPASQKINKIYKTIFCKGGAGGGKPPTDYKKMFLQKERRGKKGGQIAAAANFFARGVDFFCGQPHIVVEAIFYPTTKGAQT